MRYYLSLCILSIALVVVMTPSAHADVQASLARMDAIIKEIQSLREEFAKLANTQSVPPTPVVLGASTKNVLTQNIVLGETNGDIKKIQKLLATDKEIYPYGVSSGLFGPKTEEAIKNLQTRFGLKPVGAVGPATKALLNEFFAAYPDDIYPVDVLKKKPTVAAVVPTVVIPTPVTTTPAVTTPNTSGFKIITAVYTGSNADVRVIYTDGTKKSLDVAGNSKLKIIDAVAVALGQSKATILSHIEFVSSNSDEDEDEDEDEEDEDDDSEFKSIVASVSEGAASVKVKFSDGEKDSFEVDKDKEASIIKEVAKELDVDIADIEDIITFEYEDVDSIQVDIKNNAALATVTFEDGTTKRIKISSDDEDDIIEAIAEELDEDEDDVEDWTEFDVLD